MLFTHDTEVSLVETAALVNTLGRRRRHAGHRRGLRCVPRPQSLLRARSGGPPRSGRPFASLAPRLRRVWTIKDRDEAAALVNEILDECDAHPYLAKHDEWDWHLHVTRPGAPLADRIAAEAAMALLDLIRADELQRLRICAADDCEDVLVDLSRNRSKRYCDTGNCGNRANVAAYRARRRAGDVMSSASRRPGRTALRGDECACAGSRSCGRPVAT